ncbi:hypothetical protein CDD81_290 [Ophiocordyceps australis]|uniref:Uncharacterized protein n=1 Tax=Ophiocordyceps australis TaxID=1399860 RepID=A0A2C5Y1M3_9HYPO|nr:hypothetical protein CDD81_290 [Ophiocordyceps australis]
MASCDTDSFFSLPIWDSASLGQPAARHGASSPRTPRFHENFDAPFSETLINASRTALHDDATASCAALARQSRDSLDADMTQSTSCRTSDLALTFAPLRHGSLALSHISRRASINLKIPRWAKKSLTLPRKASDASDKILQARLETKASTSSR